jgi:hypothetical protein
MKLNIPDEYLLEKKIIKNIGKFLKLEDFNFFDG